MLSFAVGVRDLGQKGGLEKQKLFGIELLVRSVLRKKQRGPTMTSQRKSNKMDRKNAFERHKNEGQVAKEKRRANPDYLRPCRKKRADKRAAERALALGATV